MIYIHTDGVKYSDDKKTLIKCPKEVTEITILEGVTSIEEYAFHGCSGLTSIVIPVSVTSIGGCAFRGCSGLTSIVIPDSVTSIGECAFKHCTGLTSIVIPDSVTIIGGYAFLGCSSLTSIVIPDSVTGIGDNVFSDCTGLEEIRIPKGTMKEFSKMQVLGHYSDLLVEYEEEIKEDANDKEEEVKEDFNDKKGEIPEEYVAPESEELTILVNLAKAYELGIGVEKDRNKAMQYYKQAAEKGSIIAAKKMAEIYQAESEKWMMKADKLIKETAINTGQNKILFFDTETNGLPKNRVMGPMYSNNWPRIIQMGWIVTDSKGNVLKECLKYIYPDNFTVKEDVTQLTGITTGDLIEEGENIADVLDEFMQDVASATKIVGHNIDYDKNVVAAEFHRQGRSYEEIMDKPFLCTMEKSVDFCAIQGGLNNGYKWPKLQELYKKLFDTTFINAHDALADIRATKKCYFELIEQRIIK